MVSPAIYQHDRIAVCEEFFYKNKVATDCADVAIAARWIFARIHKMPAAQTLAEPNVLFSNESFRNAWSDLPTHEDWTQDQLFRVALDYVLDNTYTHTLWKDSCSIHISQPTFLWHTPLKFIRFQWPHDALYEK
jgi:hypothetical protein